MEVLAMIIVLLCVSFVLVLRKRGIILYLPNKRTKGTITKIITKHRVSWKGQKGERTAGRRVDIHEEFAEVEFYDGSKMVIAESIFPVLPFEFKVGEEVVVRYREGYKRQVWISKKK